jgi:aspartate aminotransferase-like enzyme
MGVYLTPHLHPDVFSEAPAVIAAAIAKVERTGKVPVFIRVRRYQDWLDDALVELGFTICARQAVMVKHIAAGVRAAAFTPLRQRLEAVPSPVKPPNGITETRK